MEEEINSQTRFGLKPRVIEEIQMLAKEHGLQKVILFGSRARGDFGRASDIDIAVIGGDVPLFSLDAEDRVSTLLSFDVVDLSQEVSAELRASIEGEGVALYEAD